MNIVVAENEKKTVLELETMLPLLGHRIVCIVSTGEEIIEMVGKLNPDLVFVDLDLKGEISGVEAGNIISNQYNITVIFLTVFTKNCLTKSLQLPEDAITVSKPLKQDHLKYAISRALDNH